MAAETERATRADEHELDHRSGQGGSVLVLGELRHMGGLRLPPAHQPPDPGDRDPESGAYEPGKGLLPRPGRDAFGVEPRGDGKLDQEPGVEQDAGREPVGPELQR